MNAALTELQLINAAIDARDPYFFAKLGVDRSWFTVYGEAYDFIADHIRQHNEVPTLSTVAGAVEGVEFVEFESPDVLKRRLGDSLAKRELADWLKGTDTSLPFEKLRESIEKKTRELEAKYGVKRDQATNWRTDGARRFAEYLDRESNKRQLIPSGFVDINRALTGKDDGAFIKGDYVVVYGRTKRGKSNITRKLVTLPAVRAGYNVLDLALENDRAEIEFMLDSMVSADLDPLPVDVEGVIMAGGFDRRKLMFGYLGREEKEAYRKWTELFSDSNDVHGDYIIKTFEDADMDFVTIQKIEALIDEYQPDVVLVDPIYLTTYPKVTERTPGAGAQAMSRALRRMAARKQVVIAVTAQATVEEGGRKDDDDDMTIDIPDLSKIKSTKSLLEDGTVTFGVDSIEGKAAIEIMLSRKGGAGERVDLQFWPNYGIIRPIDEAIEQQLAAAKATKLF
jgi:hypothetical protein